MRRHEWRDAPTVEIVNRWKMNPNGLSECCQETLKQHNAPGLVEGHIIDCVWCRAEMLWTNDTWVWNRKGQYSGQTDLLNEVKDNG